MNVLTHKSIQISFFFVQNFTARNKVKNTTSVDKLLVIN